MHVCCVGAALFRAGSVLAGESPMSSCAVPAGRDAEKALFSFPPSEPSITLHRLRPDVFHPQLPFEFRKSKRVI